MWMREPRMIVKGTCMIMVLAMVVNLVHAYPPGTVFNDGEYKTLCPVFQASLDLWNATLNSEVKLSGGLKKALGQAIFGSASGGDMDSLKDELPKDYRNPGHRGRRCGLCRNKDSYFPGRSITHDIMCLCTPGKDAEPFYGYYWWFGYYYKANGFKLCGQLREEMGVDLSHGWYEEGTGKKANGLEKSWSAAVMGCVNSWRNSTKTANHSLEERLTKLKETLDIFTKKFFKDRNRWDKLGGFKEHSTESDGKDEKNIHVRYGPCGGSKTPWWKRLQDLLRKNTNEKLLIKPSAAMQAEGSEGEPEEQEDEESLEEAGDMESGEPTTQEGSSQQGPIENGTQTMTQSRTNSTTSVVNTTGVGNSTYPRLEYLRSSTTITRPLCLLSASFLI
ncbi:Variant surface glycoprotein [Trypanosoma congolense IL3000]|uniref:Variant surface glycoprotein n=1 Tax=Trypanosoma congolense (strain IL3000) TaxID=1068625 RepID=F9WIE1_TRYCI|nr:Variant surface glycoprotein [Trypanosoma congolense IL3000]